MSEREERIARNEALFRQVNERLEELQEPNSSLVEQASFICECGRASCTEHITMSLGEYERLRADPVLFAVVGGHETPDVEDIVDRREGYDVVRKHPGAAAAIAEEADPRD